MRPSGAARYVLLAAGAVALAAAFGGLGRWQLERAAEVRAAAAEFRAAGAAGPVRGLAAAAADPDAFRYRVIELRGRYEKSHVLLDNITKDGAAGYDVLTAFRPQGEPQRVLVNRGWVAADPDRRAVPVAEVGGKPRRIAGRIDRLPSAPLSLGASAERLPNGVYRVSFPTVAALEELLETELAPFQIRLDPALPDGFERGSAPGTERARQNTAYAGQWFIMAAAALGLAGWAAGLARRAAQRGSS